MSGGEEEPDAVPLPKVTLGDYLEGLEKTKEGRDEQAREGLEIYVELWKKAIENGVVSRGDAVDEALEKVERSGGLYRASGTDAPDS